MMENMFSTGTSAVDQPLNAETLKRMMQAFHSLPPEPIGEWMRKQGMPPEWWQLILPVTMRHERPDVRFWPDYVAFSPLVTAPVFISREHWSTASPYTAQTEE